MSTKKEHLAFLHKKEPFHMECSNNGLFSNEEVANIRKNGHWYKALTDGVLNPITELQRNFIEVSKGQKEPISFEEKLWFRYLGRVRLQKESPEKFKLNYQFIDKDEFYSREDFYKSKASQTNQYQNQTYKEQTLHKKDWYLNTIFYILEIDGKIKFGITSNWDNRLNQYKKELNYVSLKRLYQHEYDNYWKAELIEQLLKNRLKSCIIKGKQEWVKTSIQKVFDEHGVILESISKNFEKYRPIHKSEDRFKEYRRLALSIN